ncbi:hypothetical protein [Mycobacterium sp. E2479]|uniref:hypothetical protein n=1 Tax=Mycobacterium sp. E2479 TaxID=1834134 RepID=UPI0018D4D699|nr:hypothetical protein [Mycobacterium sp. E2479]
MAADIVSSGFVIRCSGVKPSRRAMLSGAAFTGVLDVAPFVCWASVGETLATSREAIDRPSGAEVTVPVSAPRSSETGYDRTSFPQIPTSQAGGALI